MVQFDRLCSQTGKESNLRSFAFNVSTTAIYLFLPLEYSSPGFIGIHRVLENLKVTSMHFLPAPYDELLRFMAKKQLRLIAHLSFSSIMMGASREWQHPQSI